MRLRDRLGRWTTWSGGALLLGMLSGCGGPIDEVWAGEEKRCTDGNNTSSSVTDVELRLKGPVTGSPDGTWRYALSNGGWNETDIQDSSYLGTTLKFTTEFRVTVFLLGEIVYVTDYELTRSPGKLEGTSVMRGNNSTTTCDVLLTPKR